jgi:predicted HTH domain antitoxin
MLKMADAFVKLPKSLVEEIRIIPKLGVYKSESEFVRDAVKTFLMARLDLRTSLAVEMYKEGVISMGRVSELTDLNLDGARKLLESRGVRVTRGPKDAGDLRKGSKRLLDISK